ncbi:MAG: FxLYD domain-containing protein [Candidatus Bathyarchaeota archaeon]|nr:FxLYD domain-containing protein [Candidatus Bathyarchaeota archaeon]
MTKIFLLSTKSLIFLFFLLSIVFVPLTVDAAPQVEIVSHSSYIGPYGYFTVTGEVLNTGDQYAIDVEISATFYNSANDVLGTDSGDSSLSYLLPDRKSPFRFVFLDYEQAGQVDHYSLDVDFGSTDASFPEKLAITSHSSSIVEDQLLIEGEVENLADSTASLVKVVATCYDAAGTVIGTDGQSALSIEAHQKATFQIDVYSENVQSIDSYELAVQSPFYVEIPEFSSFLLIILTFLVASICLLLYKRSIIKNP